MNTSSIDYKNWNLKANPQYYNLCSLSVFNRFHDSGLFIEL